MAPTLKARLQSCQQRIDAMQLRERLLLMAAGVAVMFLLVDSLWLQPALKAQRVSEAQIAELEAKLNGLRQNTRLLTYSEGEDSLHELARERERLQTQLAGLDERIVSLSGLLMEPTQAARVLERLLENYAGLKLTALSAHREPLDATRGPAERDTYGLSRYQVDMLISGGYLELLQYLKKLEKLPWKLFWQQANFQTTRYPQAETRLQLYILAAGHE